MAPIPLPLALSNASTLLTWLCVYIPHHLLVLLLVAGLLSFATLALLTLLGICCLLKRFFSFLQGAFTRKHSIFSPLRKPPPEPRLRANFRHRSCPVHAPSLRCPHCLAEIPFPSSPKQGGLDGEYFPSPPMRIPPHRRASDVTPKDSPPLTPTPFVPQPETRITTPPHRESSPSKEPVRRSPRPPKPRKLED